MTERALRYGWTTGACAAAASKTAYAALLGDGFLDPVTITLPKGEKPSFPLAYQGRGEDAHGAWALAGVIKDAGDDPDVTHGALIIATVRAAAPGAGVLFRAGPGVGMVTKPGLPIPVGEPAINPAPRALIAGEIVETAAAHGASGDVEVEISVPGGAALAAKTWNPRLGIEGGLSILGTTGIVRPFSCAAWIASIHRGVDVVRANGLPRAIAATGSTSEAAARARYPDLPDIALLDMGDFAGGLLKYVRTHPLPALTIAGGFAKMTKLAQGALDLHSGRSQVDFDALALWAADLGVDPAAVRACNTAAQALELAGPALAQRVATAARAQAVETLRGAAVPVETLVVDRAGRVLGHAP